MTEPRTLSPARASAGSSCPVEREIISVLLLLMAIAGGWWVHLLWRGSRAEPRQAVAAQRASAPTAALEGPSQQLPGGWLDAGLIAQPALLEPTPPHAAR